MLWIFLIITVFAILAIFVAYYALMAMLFVFGAFVVAIFGGTYLLASSLDSRNEPLSIGLALLIGTSVLLVSIKALGARRQRNGPPGKTSSLSASAERRIAKLRSQYTGIDGARDANIAIQIRKIREGKD